MVQTTRHAALRGLAGHYTNADNYRGNGYVNGVVVRVIIPLLERENTSPSLTVATSKRHVLENPRCVRVGF